MTNVKDLLKLIIVPIHKEGYKFIIIFALAAIILSLINDTLGLFGLVATLWCIYFFRDPERIIPDQENAVVSPADGVITKIEENVNAPAELEIKNKKFTKISVFLNVFNVHVNRSPVSGSVEKVVYIPGKFLGANFDESSDENERNVTHVKTKDKKDVIFSQVAGMIARRIICDIKEGDEVKVGDRYGIIRFGSRVDIFLPKDYKILVKNGQTMIGGETVIANS